MKKRFDSAWEFDDYVDRLWSGGIKTPEGILAAIKKLGYSADLPHIKLSMRAIGALPAKKPTKMKAKPVKKRKLADHLTYAPEAQVRARHSRDRAIRSLAALSVIPSGHVPSKKDVQLADQALRGIASNYPDVIDKHWGLVNKVMKNYGLY